MSAKLKKKTLKAQATEGKKPGKWDFIKIKNFCASNETNG